MGRSVPSASSILRHPKNVSDLSKSVLSIKNPSEETDLSSKCSQAILKGNHAILSPLS